MRATVRRTSLATLHADATLALSRLDIDDAATYSETLAVYEPGKPDAIRTENFTGREVRQRILIQLQVTMHEAEQNEPTAITLRWTRQSKRNDYVTKSCTYTQLTTGTGYRRSPAPEAPAPVQLSEETVTLIGDINLVAEAGDPEDALTLSTQLVRAGNTKHAIDVRRSVTKGVLDREYLRKLARRIEKDTRTLLAA
ncbi:hypothetical protein OV450_1391 [Actinobacteria bacterium OV450]|nr:hypothetical protein OV450_1391 [Actinobacteria bacterium OV450]